MSGTGDIVRLVATSRLWRIFYGSSRGHIPLILAAAFVPGLINLRAGHITPFVLLGMAAFLGFRRAQHEILAGASVALFLLKPHLLWLILLLLGWDIVRHRRFKVLLGLLGGTVLLLIIPLVLDPVILQEYAQAIAALPMLASYAPNFGGLLRSVFGYQHYWLQFAPCLPGLAFLIYAAARHYEDDWECHLPLLALVSFLTSPYGWSYDEVVLLPAFVQIAARVQGSPAWLPRTALTVYLAANTAVLLVSHWRPHDFYLLWTSPLWLLLYCVGLLMARQERVAPPVGSRAICSAGSIQY